MDQHTRDALSELEALKPKQHFKGPLKLPSINCRAKVQHIEDDNSPPPTQEQIKFIQQVIGKFLFMAGAVDDTLLHALNDRACQASKGTQQTWEAAQHVFECIACNTTPVIKCRASDVILKAESDAAFDVTPDSEAGLQITSILDHLMTPNSMLQFMFSWRQSKASWEVQLRQKWQLST